MPRGLGKNQRKILLILLGVVVLGFAGTPKRYYYTVREIKRAWIKIDKMYDEKQITKSVERLSRVRLIRVRSVGGGEDRYELTEKGRRIAFTYHADRIKIRKPKRWQGNWYILIFDVPERLRKVRDALRNHLVEIGFYELQKSVWVYPHECRNELYFILDLYQAHPFANLIITKFVDDDKALKRHFKIS